ncbi:FkbH-like protein/FkbM family methyltransferase [Xanthomonas arboricola]|uniref:FkbM family methyltransferase n=1 Tax=Xanthomonas euroxanthea TaxID=2259622 RepID=UPI00160C2365|nr:FkbM family methyltransferase [Xanthomonas euroxanthea]MBB3815156.1 FkbH-like protein/FkbM family methyltransferase [Xanthomonas euroxanthea]
MITDTKASRENVATRAVAPHGPPVALPAWSLQERAVIAAHRVGQRAVVPAALVVTRVLDTVAAQGAPCQLGGLLFHTVLAAEDALQCSAIPTGDDTALGVRVSRLHDDGDATLAVELLARPLAVGGAPCTDTAALPEHGDRLDVGSFYRSLADAGNTFLPALRLLAGLHRQGHRIRVEIAGQDAPAAACLDACLHALLALPDHPPTCGHLIQSIDRIDVWGPLNGQLFATGWLRNAHARGFVADLQVCNGRGQVVAEIVGVAYAQLARNRPTLSVAGNISLEPFQEAFDSLAEGAGLCVRAADFDQVHQTLLDPTGVADAPECSELLLLVDLSQWDAPGLLAQGAAWHQAQAAGAKVSLLPNQLQVLGLNRYETDYLYEEIFDDRSYLRDNIVLDDDDVVLDIGANIGLFSLHVLDLNPSVRILAFEPSPVTAVVARANLEGRGRATVYQQGVAEASGSAVFTHYATSTVFSGFHVDPQEDRRAIKQVIENRLSDAQVDGQHDSYVEDLVAHRLEGHQVEVALTSVSDVIDQHGLASVGLLKVDAEKSEDAILRGIRTEHWPRIRQLMLEVHDQDGVRTARIVRFLESMGYTVVLREEEKLRQSGLVALSATRIPMRAMPSIGRNARALQSRCSELLASLQTFRARSGKPVTIVLATSHPASAASPHMRRQYRHVAAGLRRAVAALPGVSVVAQREVLRRYAVSPVEAVSAQVEDAGVPFPMEWYAATAMWALRAHAQRQRGLKKVLVVDCDNTLWQGLCAEDGPRGVVITTALRRWQAFLRAQRHAGVLLCLCSHNVAEDVWAVFAQHPDMLLRAEDIALAKIGWAPKSTLIAEIAADLDLAIDSLVFVDDNPAECLQVGSAHPGVSCLVFPQLPTQIDAFWQHTWELDLLRRSPGGTDRVQLYQQEGQRKAFRRAHDGLKAFVDGLQLVVELEALGPEHGPRVTELAQRTNQFNLHARLRSADMVNAYLHQPEVRGWIVRARDRFGDYGLVGACYGEFAADAFRMENILLSCRVLGRGVEQRLGQLLATALEEQGVRHGQLQALCTARNVPATNFFRAVTGQDAAVGAAAFTTTAMREIPLMAVAPDSLTAVGKPAPAAGDPAPGNEVQWDTRWERWIFDVSHSAVSIADAIWGARGQGEEADAASTTEAEHVAYSLWRDVLGTGPLHRDDDFFVAGGTSMQLVRLVSAVNRHFGIALRLSDLYGNASLAVLGTLIDERLGRPSQPVAAGNASALALAPTQEGLWFIHTLNPASPAYLAAVAACVSAPVQAAALQLRLRRLLQTDPVLAGRYRLDGARTVVGIDPGATLPVVEVDAADWTLARLVEHASDASRQPIDLQQGPLLRTYLYRWTGARTVLLLVSHHLVVDLRSLELLLARLLDDARESHGAADRDDFMGFAAAHRRALESDVGDALRREWARRLADPPPPLLERVTNETTYSAAGFAVATASIGSTTLQRLADGSGALKSSTFLVLFSAFVRHCSEFFARKEFMVGTPVSLREDERYAEAIGNFVTTLPIRARVPDGDFSILHAAVREAFIDALSGKALPLHRISQGVAAGRRRVAMVQVLFSYHADETGIPIQQFCDHGQLSAPFRLGELPCQILGLHQQMEQVELALETFACDRGLGLNLKYSLAYLGKERAQQFLQTFVTLLEKIASERMQC